MKIKLFLGGLIEKIGKIYAEIVRAQKQSPYFLWL